MGQRTSEKVPAAAKQSAGAQKRVAQAAGPARDGCSHLQHQIGNRAMGRLLASQGIQAKLVVSPAGDQWEAEADRVADMLAPAKPVSARSFTSQAFVQRKCPECESEERVELRPKVGDGMKG